MTVYSFLDAKIRTMGQCCLVVCQCGRPILMGLSEARTCVCGKFYGVPGATAAEKRETPAPVINLAQARRARANAAELLERERESPCWDDQFERDRVEGDDGVDVTLQQTSRLPMAPVLSNRPKVEALDEKRRDRQNKMVKDHFKKLGLIPTDDDPDEGA